MGGDLDNRDADLVANPVRVTHAPELPPWRVANMARHCGWST
jgi:hypothetical protein